MSCVIERSSPTNLLKRVLFPTFGRPTIETRGIPGARIASPSSGSGSKSSASTRSRIASSKSPDLRPCRAETAIGSPKPRDRKSQRSDSRRSESILLETTSTGRSTLRNHCAINSSSWVTPTQVSTTNSTRSAALAASSTWRLTLVSNSEPPGIQPPVSTTLNFLPIHSTSRSKRSRVIPGWSSTIATWAPKNLLKRVLFPTLGRPTITTVGNRSVTHAFYKRFMRER